MKKTLLDEPEFLAYIIEQLVAQGYVLRDASKFDPIVSMDKELLLQFLESTQHKTMEKHKDVSLAYEAKKHITDYVFTDGYAKNGESTERQFAEALDAADEVEVFAKLPRTFYIPTPVGNYAPDWAIAFKKGSVKHIFFVAETKGSMDSMQLKGVEKAKIDCAEVLFNKTSTSEVRYHKVTSYSDLLNVMQSID